MKFTLSFPLEKETLAAYESWEDLQRSLTELGCAGLEGIWAGEPLPQDLPADLITGYHLTFYPDWLDFCREDHNALRRKFGTLEAAYQFYGGSGPETLLALYRADLQRARSLGAEYVVFHVSDVSIEGTYTYRWLHTDEEVIDASVEISNRLLEGVAPNFDFLVENQWWPGFTFTEPEKTARLLEGISYARKGILLDTGHLMNTCPQLQTQMEGVRYLHQMLDRHGGLAAYIRGVHLHQSLSGAYVRAHVGQVPACQAADYVTRFSRNYRHILNIDQHRPWTEPEIGSLLERIAPAYVTHELAAGTRQQREQAVRTQKETLEKRGGCP